MNWKFCRPLLIAHSMIVFGSLNAWAVPQCEPTLQDAQRMLPEANSQDFIVGLNVSLILALKPRTFPETEIQDLTDACTRGAFISSEHEYSVFGSDTDSPPRWAVSESQDRIAYVALAPPPNTAFDWYSETGGKGPLKFDDQPIYIVAIVNSEFRDVYAFLETLPSDDQLIRLFQAALDGKSKRLVRFNTDTNKMNLTATASEW